MATLQEARQQYRQTFGLDPAPSFTADQLMRAVDKSTDLEFMRQLYESEFGIDLSGEEWAGDDRDAGFLQRAIRANNELQDARADYATAGGLPDDFDWSSDQRSTEQLRRGIAELTGGPDDLSPYDTTEEEAASKGGVGISDDDPDTPDLTILKGDKMSWHFDKQAGQWYVEYGLPNSDRSMLFEADPDQMDALFGEGVRPQTSSTVSLKQLTQRSGVTFAGNIAEMEGTGRFESEVERVTALALDDGKLPDWAAQDGVALDIIFTAQSEGKSTDWVLDQLSKTQGFKTRFPKIQTFMDENNLSLGEGIQGFLEMEAGVKQALQSTGQGINTVTPELVGNLLDQGHSLKTVQDTAKGFKRMKEFQPAMQAFNEVLQAQGMAPMSSIQEMLDFVSGKAPAEIYDLYEQSSIQEAAVGAGLGDVFSVQDAIQTARGTEQTLETATQGMQKAAELLLRMRNEVDVGKFDLDHEELIDVSLGMTPRSGRSQAEIFESVNRAVLSAQGNLQKKANPFRSFSETGTPQAASLGNLRQQS